MFKPGVGIPNAAFGSSRPEPDRVQPDFRPADVGLGFEITGRMPTPGSNTGRQTPLAFAGLI